MKHCVSASCDHNPGLLQLLYEGGKMSDVVVYELNRRFKNIVDTSIPFKVGFFLKGTVSQLSCVFLVGMVLADIDSSSFMLAVREHYCNASHAAIRLYSYHAAVGLYSCLPRSCQLVFMLPTQL